MVGILPLAILYFAKKKFNNEFILYLISSVLATAGIIFANYFNIGNSLIFKSFLICTILFLSFFFLKIFFTKIFKIIVSILFSVCLIIFFLNNENYFKISLLIENLTFVICPILFFLDRINDSKETKNNSLNIIVSSIFFYKTSTFILFYFISELLLNNLWFVHNLIEGISKLLIAYAFWKLPKTSNF